MPVQNEKLLLLQTQVAIDRNSDYRRNIAAFLEQERRFVAEKKNIVNSERAYLQSFESRQLWLIDQARSWTNFMHRVPSRYLIEIDKVFLTNDLIAFY